MDTMVSKPQWPPCTVLSHHTPPPCILSRILFPVRAYKARRGGGDRCTSLSVGPPVIVIKHAAGINERLHACFRSMPRTLCVGRSMHFRLRTFERTLNHHDKLFRPMSRSWNSENDLYIYTVYIYIYNFLIASEG